MKLKNIRVLNILRIYTPEELKSIPDYAGSSLIEVVKTTADCSFFDRLSGMQYVNMDFIYNPTEFRLCLVHASVMMDNRKTLSSQQLDALILRPNPKLIFKVETAYAKYLDENYVDEDLETVRKAYRETGFSKY